MSLTDFRFSTAQIVMALLLSCTFVLFGTLVYRLCNGSFKQKRNMAVTPGAFFALLTGLINIQFGFILVLLLLIYLIGVRDIL